MSTTDPSPNQLREAIAEAVWGHVSADDVVHFGDVIEMPAGSDGRDPWKANAPTFGTA
jgi:hypothetical protein